MLKLVKGRFGGPLPSPEDVCKVLIVQVENLGDYLISVGFSKAVREAFPNAKITMLVDSKFQELVGRYPYYDEVLAFNQSGGRAYRLFAGPVRAFRTSREHLWKQNFDLVLNQRWDVDSKHGGVLGMFALGRHHIGFSPGVNPRKKLINIGMGWMFTRSINPVGVIHDGLRGGQLLEALGLPGGTLLCEIYTTPQEDDFARANLDKTIGGGPLVALGIGANLARRQWPIQSYDELVRWILDKFPGACFLVVGHAGDGNTAESLRGTLGKRLLNFGGRCSLGQSTALLRRANYYFGTESGPMHMAAAVGVPLVTFFALPPFGPPDHPNSPIRYAPVTRSRAIILQPPNYAAPCNYGCSAAEPHCILGVDVEMAKAALAELFRTEVPL